MLKIIDLDTSSSKNEPVYENTIEKIDQAVIVGSYLCGRLEPSGYLQFIDISNPSVMKSYTPIPGPVFVESIFAADEKVMILGKSHAAKSEPCFYEMKI